jgi:hypothetical protein
MTYSSLSVSLQDDYYIGSSQLPIVGRTWAFWCYQSISSDVIGVLRSHDTVQLRAMYLSEAYLVALLVQPSVCCDDKDLVSAT